MKISIIGAGNVGSMAAMRLAQQELGEIVLVDIAGDLAQGKACDIADAASLLKQAYAIAGTRELSQTAESDVVAVTAGLARKPGMTREELLLKNAAIIKELCSEIKKYSPEAILIIVTNPLDLMTNYALRVTGFRKERVMGMGLSLDASRFANLISLELRIPVTDIDPCVIGSHGQGMLPLSRFTTVKGVPLEEFLDEGQVQSLIKRTVERGAEIVSYLGTGSAFFAPSAGIAMLARAVVKDEKRIIGVCAYLEGEYGISDVCIGVPCRIGRLGVEQVVELGLDGEERKALHASAEQVRQALKQL